MEIEYISVPIGSLALLPPEQSRAYIRHVLTLPEGLRTLLFNQRSGAFIRGAARSRNLDDRQTGLFALTVLRVVIGEIKPEQFSHTLATTLSLPPEEARALAKETMDDLIIPAIGQGNALPQDAAAAQPEANVLDLKNRRPTPPPPPMPTGSNS